LWELKSNIDPNLIEISDVMLPADMEQQWTALPQEVRTTVINHVHATKSSEQNVKIDNRDLVEKQSQNCEPIRKD
jgi:hypothetical protein